MRNGFFYFICIVSISLMALPVEAQSTIPNPGFENWSGALPTNWNSNSDGSGYAPLGPQTCFQCSTDPHSGSYCVEIVSGSSFGVVVNGTCTTGEVEAPTTDKSDGFIATIPGNPSYSAPFTATPDSLVGWYRYSPQGGDAASMTALLHVDAGSIPETLDGNTTANIIAQAMFTTPAATVSDWTRFSVPFVYNDSRTPQYILIVLTSSADASGGTSGSTLYVDDLDVIYNPAISTGTVNTGPYYVTASSGVSVSVPFTLSGTINPGNVVTAQLSDANGSFADPVNIGSLSVTYSSTINATIPAGTASGTGYRIRVIMNGPNLTAADNGSDITINLVNNSIAPATTQTIAANTNGTTLTLSENPVDSSQVWEYSTSANGPFGTFYPYQTGTSYTPNFTSAGTYYVEAISTYPGNVKVGSNTVQINVAQSSVTPGSPQSILVAVTGKPLSVTETPAATSREWEYSLTSGGPYNSFSPVQTDTSYTPLFDTAGTYYIVCESQISGISVISNEVIVSVGDATISTGAVYGSPFLLSPSAHNIPIQVPYTNTGTFNAGNVFTAQLSDSTGSFTNATNIGSRSATTSGSISAIIQYNTPAGLHYRIRVISSNPVLYGSDNGMDLVVDQFHNSIAPPDTQNIQYNTPGSMLTVTESQPATRVWEYSYQSGGPYNVFVPSDTSTTYTPEFDSLTTYYIVAISENDNGDYVTSNEVPVNILNGATLSTDSITGAPFLVSPRANVQVQVNFTSDVIFGQGNIFQAQLSDDTGSFGNPVVIGADTGTTIQPINAVIPNGTSAGTGYRIRVVSSNPAINGTDNGTDLQVIPFQVSIAPLDTQTLLVNQPGNTLIVIESQPATQEWKYSGGAGYNSFDPPQTGTACTPQFDIVGRWYVECQSVNADSDTIVSVPVVIFAIDTPAGINDPSPSTLTAWWDNNNLQVDLRKAQLKEPVLELINTAGQSVVFQDLTPDNLNSVPTELPAGVYLFRIQDGSRIFSGNTVKTANR